MNQIQTLTPAQNRIINVVVENAKSSRPQFIPQLLQKLDLGESGLTPTLKILERKGWINIEGGGQDRSPRMIWLTNAAKRVLGVGGLPVLGSITAGGLQEAIQESEEFVETGEFLKTKMGDFLLRVKGDSMVEAGILNNDLALIRPNQELKKGNIAAVYAGDNYKTTLKKVFIEPSHVRLEACNSNYEDILVPYSQWRGIAGVYCGLVRDASN